MTSDYLWYLPTHGDGRGLSAGAFHHGERGNKHRPPTLDYLTQVALAAEAGDFYGTLIPTGPYCEDAWAVAAAVSTHTQRLRSLVAFRPGFVLPAVAAQTVATYQRFTGDRLLLNVVTGGSSTEQRAYGDYLDHDARYERTDEFLSVVRGTWNGPGFNFEGRHYRLDSIPEGAIEHAQRQFAKSESVGQSRMVGLHHGKIGRARDLEVYPNLWAGVGLVRGGAGTAVIGSHDQVAARIAEFESLGVDTFIFSAYPNLEEAVRVGEDLLPLLRGQATPRAELSLVGAS